MAATDLEARTLKDAFLVNYFHQTSLLVLV